ERLAGEVVQWYGQRGLASDQARALAVRSMALLALGRQGAASEAASQAAALAQASESSDLQIFVTTAGAPAGASSSPAVALERVREAVARADQLGFVTAGLEARLALGSLELATGRKDAGRATLEELCRIAGSKGHKGLAQRAEQALAGTPQKRQG
ncbi:MAG TPA: hypothetical protein VIJ36_05980, partial [Thermoanaerobaculia bacterium]